ncbi:putative calcium signaling protein kinase RAD53 [Cardiosporidium cionae]|uniref:Calcium signaling protein kinase RAD53 n=1 Tax=Cardiosporidium cionae TaxID=476202 RepID=A0ABQ7J8X9_9APIC|nr:putative calcium signaling protein kinase RAD53 [Cardiosporidium cionae]|eukprot:KAF8820437.1 putative calcium signaling protein kinase RAD53 [Cardiosporidium cionae]
MPSKQNLPSVDPRFRLGITTGRRFCSQFTGAVYELTESIGIGATAVVFRCIQSNSESLPYEDPQANSDSMPKVFAAKVVDLKALRLRPNVSKERKKLLQEVEILKNLRHSHIVNLVDFAETTNEFFFVMEYVKDGDLFNRIATTNGLKESQACYIMHQLVSGVKYMHGENVIHRDLKPENILICCEGDGEYFQVKIADFGLAKLVRRGFSAACTFVGTPQYWAPEVIHASRTNSTYNESADLWSLGVILYVMLGGVYPFDDKLGNINALICNGQYNFHTSRFRHVSSEAKALIRKLLTVDVQSRYSITQLQVDPWMLSFLNPEDKARFRMEGIVFPKYMSSSSSRSVMPLLPPIDSSLESYDVISVVNEFEKDELESDDEMESTSGNMFMFSPASHQPVETNRGMKKASSPRSTHAKYANPSSPLQNDVAPPMTSRPVHGVAKAYYAPTQEALDKKLHPNASHVSNAYHETTRHHHLPPRRFSPDEHPNEPPAIRFYASSHFSAISESPTAQPSPKAFPIVQNVDTGQLGTGIPGVHSFQFSNLLSFQLNVAMRMHLAAFAFRDDARLRSIVGDRLGECFEAQKLTLCVSSRFEQTCVSILSIIPDLTIAITENLPDLSLSILNDILVWISPMMTDVTKMRRQYNTLVNGLNKLITVIEGIKKHVESKVNSFISSTPEEQLLHCGSTHKHMLKLADAMYHSDGTAQSNEIDQNSGDTMRQENVERQLKIAMNEYATTEAHGEDKTYVTSVKVHTNRPNSAFIEMAHLRNRLLKQLESFGNPKLSHPSDASEDKDSSRSLTEFPIELLDSLFLNSGMNTDMLTSKEVPNPSSLADVIHMSEVADNILKDSPSQMQSSSSRETRSSERKLETLDSTGKSI